MSYCLNPYCRQPQNPDTAKFCSQCGFKLLLGDRYRALQPIGRGGFGRTFLAVDEYKPSHPQCVIKQFFPQNRNAQDSKREWALFQREAIQLEQLGQHAQIPELLAHFEQANYQYLVQEYIDGFNLLQELERTGPFSEKRVWQLLNDLLPVLSFVHNRQVIHRDIKPQNIIRRHANSNPKEHQYVLVDFGAAKSLAGFDSSFTGTSIGSPAFVAPEQAIGKATYASDLYSLGVTCIYLLTQVRPVDLFDTQEGVWVWQHHVTSPVSNALGDVLHKLLQGPIKLRYQSAEDVLKDLRSPAVLQAIAQSVNRSNPSRSNPSRSVPRSEFGTALSQDAILPETVLPETVLPETALPETALPETALPETASAAISPAIEASEPRSPESKLPESKSPESKLPESKLPESKLPESKLPEHPVETPSHWIHQRTLAGHESWVRSVVIHSDGYRLASGSGDKTVKIWNFKTGDLLQTIDAHVAWVRAIASSPNGKLLASCSNDKTVKLWDWDTGNLLRTLEGHTDWVRAVAFSPDGQTLATAGQDKTSRLWRISTGDMLHSFSGHRHWVTAVAYSPDGTVLASGSRDKTIRVWNWKTGKLLWLLEGHQQPVNAIAIFPNGQILASAGDDNTINLWDLSQGTLLHTLMGHTGAINSLAVSSDSNLLVSASHDRTVRVWCLRTHTLLYTARHSNWVWSVAMSLDGATLASGGWDGTIQIWQR